MRRTEAGFLKEVFKDKRNLCRWTEARIEVVWRRAPLEPWSRKPNRLKWVDGRKSDEGNDVSLESWVDCLLKTLRKREKLELNQWSKEHHHKLFNGRATEPVLCLRNVNLNYLKIAWNTWQMKEEKFNLNAFVHFNGGILERSWKVEIQNPGSNSWHSLLTSACKCMQPFFPITC